MNLSRFITYCLGSLAILPVMAEKSTPTTQNIYPVGVYQELPNPTATDVTAWKNIKSVKTGWGDSNTRYAKELPASGFRKQLSLKGWKGEKVSAQLVVSTPDAIERFNYVISPLVHTSDKGKRIDGDAISQGFVRYVMTDELNKDGKGGCGHRPDASVYDSSLVADPIDHLNKTLPLSAQTSQGGWVSIQIPGDAQPGTYRGKVSVRNGEKELSSLDLSVEVIDRTLAAPSEWSYHLDLWQNPFATARYYNVQPWSDEHFEAMRPDMELYAKAGGKVITTSIMHKPWNGQTYDYFESMVTWMKKADGTWYYDFTVFDKWVEFMMSVGVKKQIACYSLIPWHLSFQYFDQATNSFKFLNTEPGKPEFAQHWGGMLKAFAAHLKQKGWFEITHISMDERGMEAMLATLNVIREADPEFKISMAGTLFPELEEELDDYCVALQHKFTPEILRARKDKGQVSTYYTSCTEIYPNTFTFSAPAECEWLAWYAAKEGFEGYLRWALNSWVAQPLQDSRFHTWAAGDTYMIYPGGRTSMRYEKMIDGIQAYEKIQTLKAEFERKNDKGSLRKLQKALDLFQLEALENTPAAQMTVKANQILNSL